MKILNPNNLPDALVKAVTPEDRAINPKRMSVTDLINPPLMRTLKHRHWHEMTENVEDRAWLMLGSAFHHWIQKKTGIGAEIKFETEWEGYTLVGVADLIDKSTIVDYKVTSAYSFLFGDKPEWEQQLNCYHWLAGHKTTKLQIIAILRDWVESKTYSDPQYPKSAILVKDIPVWTADKQIDYIADRLKLHRDNPEAPCTPEEKWQKPEKWAVKIPNVYKAKRVLDSQKEAEEWAVKNFKGKYEIEHRQGEDSRCRRYCGVAAFCPYNIYKEERNEDCS